GPLSPAQRRHAMFADTEHWWFVLRAIGALNIALWLAAGVWMQRRGLLAARSTVRLQWWLCGGYVLCCAFRSFFPVFDVPRQAMVDSWLSSAFVGRSVATVAELCFAAQWALLLSELGRRQCNGSAEAIAGALLPLIALAECFSWSSVLTT